MSENSQRRPKDPVRIVYHAENRTFARLFNECSLDEVKDVVRRKLGLGRDTDVSLKQMGSNTLLDLEDDDDFQAFSILLNSSESVDIQITVGTSQGSVVPPPIAPSREKPSVGEPLVTSLAPHPKEPPTPAQPTVVASTKVSTATKKASDTTRKRKVSFSGEAEETPGKPAKKHGPTKSTATTAAASVEETSETPATAKPTEEPPKKKRKTTKPLEPTPLKATDTPKAKVKRTATGDRNSKAGTRVPKDIETPEQPAKKIRKKKEKQPEPIETDDTDPSDYEPANKKSLQPTAEKPEMSSVEGSESNSEAPIIGVCASIPQTSASISVRSEIAAAILGYASKASETTPPKPPAKRKSVRGTATESFTSNTLPAEPTAVSRAANETPTVLTERRHEVMVPTRESPQQTLELNGPSCPICLEVPFHIRYCCPIVQKGPHAIRERLEELKRTNADDQQPLIKELHDLLRDSKVSSEPVVSTDDVQSREVSQPSDASVSRTPNIPSNSYLSEVTVESRNEGSSSECSDASEREGEYKGPPASRRQEASSEQPLPFNDDLEAVIRGPTSRRQSVLGILDRIVGNEDDSDSEDDKAGLEEDPDEEIDRSVRRLSKHITHASRSESEGDSSSPSPSRSVENVPNGLKPPTLDSSKAVIESAEREDDGAVTRNSHDPPVLRAQDGHSSEETHVGSDDRMFVDGSIGDKDTVTVEQLSPVPRAPVPQSLNAPIKEPQVSGEATDGPTSHLGDNSEVAGPDPIEPADEMETPHVAHLSNPDPIEAATEDVGSFFSGVTQSTPAPGVARRLKTRHGDIIDDEAERPVLLDQLSVEAPPSTKKRKGTETNSQETVTTRRRSCRLSSLLPATSTPAAPSPLNDRAKAKAAKTPAKESEERSDALQNGVRDDVAQNGARLAAPPSVARWEMLAEPLSSPSIQPDEPSMLLDELMPSSPHPESKPNLKRPNARGTKVPPRISQAGSSRGEQRLFDLTPSQVPFPYSQHKNRISTVPASEEKEVSTDSEEEPLAKVTKNKPKLAAPYRTLSQLASQATLYSPSLPTPTNKNAANGKTRKRTAAEDSSSSSSSSEEEANESTHIPRGRRAGSILETKKRKKSILSKI